MVGYLRLFLAYLVLLSHVNVRVFGMNPGVFAVITFYILSGYVVTRLWDEILPQGKGRLWYFYRDRILRIAPLYLYVCILTLIFLLITGYGTPQFAPVRLLGNLLIIPLNYYMWFDTTILTEPAWCLIPPGWSLGAEEQAYLLMSMLLLWRPGKHMLTPVSLLIFMLASFTILHPDYYGYRLPPGVLFIFIVGHSLRRIQNKRAGVFDKIYPRLLWLIIVAVGGWLLYHNQYHVPYIRETFSGLLFGIPAVFFFNTLNLRLPGNALCGSLSYGLFLSHFLVIWALDFLGMSPVTSGFAGLNYIVLLTIITLVVSWVGVRWIESPIDIYRKNLGKKSAPH